MFEVQPLVFARRLTVLLGDFLDHSAEAHPDREAMVCGGRRLSFAELHEGARRLCLRLQELGLRRREPVAIHLGNSAEAVMAVFAVVNAGGIFVLLNPLLKPRKMASILNNSGAVALLTDTAVGASCAREAATVRFMLVDGPQARSYCCEPGTPSHELREAFEAGSMKFAEAAGAESDVCGLIYTSGSTGSPKGVTLSHRNMVAAADAILSYLDISDADTVLNLLPMSSDYGLYNILLPIRRGARVILDRAFLHPGQIVGPLNDEGVTGLPLNPCIVAILRRFGDLSVREPKRLRWITSTGQVLPPAHSAWLGRTFPHASIYSMYGVTECKRVSYLAPEQLEKRPTSVGRAIPGTEVALVDDNGEPVREPGVVGELLVRGPHVMQGYWRDPEKTEAVLERGPAGRQARLRTGDLFTMDEEGYLYFVGRRDGVIKSGGYRVSPREVEDAVYELDGVCHVAVVAQPHDVLGHSLRLIVVPEEGADLNHADVRRHCEHYLEAYAMPRDIEIRERLPLTPAGKVDYRKVAAEGPSRRGEGVHPA